MQASADFQMSGVETTQMYWEQVRDWVETAVTRERMEGAVYLAAGAAVTGTILFALHKAIEAYTFTGMGNSGFGLF